jgi:LPXTG-motif cell wall-anchored protein
MLDTILEFMGQTWFMVVMGVVLVGLIGVFLVLRNRRTDDDE